MAEDRKMKSNMRKKIMAILLSGVICASNFAVPSFASEIAVGSIVESETEGDIVSASTEIMEDNTEESTVENTAENTEDNSARALDESEQDILTTLSAETGTFADLGELKTFYENNTVALQDLSLIHI